MRPGKPLMAGRLGRPSVMLGLPGNPVSALVCADLFLRPLLRALQGDPAPVAPRGGAAGGAVGPTARARISCVRAWGAMAASRPSTGRTARC
jgi:molybdopterin molybdotransferase